MADRLLTVKEAAAILQVKPDTIRSWIRTGELPAIDVSSDAGSGKPRFRISEVALNQFLTTRAVVPNGKPKRRQIRRGDAIQFF